MKNIIFYGGGNIAQAVAEGLIKSGYKKNNIFYVDRNSKNKQKLEKLQINSLKDSNLSKTDLSRINVFKSSGNELNTYSNSCLEVASTPSNCISLA